MKFQTTHSREAVMRAKWASIPRSIAASMAIPVALITAITAMALPLVVTTAMAADDPVQHRLNTSPRHHEWVVVKNGERSVHVFVAYPEVKEKAAVVLVIHENKGLTDWVRALADELAEAGVIAVAPDLLSGAGPNGGKTSDFPSVDAATQAIYKLPADQVTADLDAVADFALKIPAANGKLAVAGFCWGGGQSFHFATHRKDLKASFVFYGPAPESKDDLARVACPVYGFYGGGDARISATVPGTAAQMKEAGKSYDPVTYDGAGHGFMRSGDDRSGAEADVKARDAAWERWRKILKGI
jgi:carboxymethylenebutenolidase